MKKIVLFLLFSIPFLLPAQNYQNICSPGTTFFKDKDSYLKAFRRDSIYLPGNNDSVFISYTTIRDSLSYNGYSYQCKDTTNGDALGRKIIKKHDGWVFFFNKKNDTLKIQTQAALNQSWKYCNLPGNGWLEAKVTAITTDSILGIPDEIKIISLQSKDISNNNIPGIFNQKQIKLSKHYGLSEMYDIYFTPSDTVHYLLTGKTTPSIGVQLFTWRDVYNFNVGDEFHKHGFYHVNGGGSDWYSIETILGKTVYDNLDSVAYTSHYCKKQYAAGGQFISNDTITEKYNFIQLSNDNLLDLLPDEFIPGFGSPGFFVPTYSRMISYNGRPVQISQSDSYEVDSSGCYTLPFEGTPSINYFSPDLGRVEFQYYFLDGSVTEWAEFLVYFKKGSETWGTPVSTDCKTLVDIPSVVFQEKPDVKIIPNPIENRGTIIVENYFPGKNIHLNLYDYLGRKIFQKLVTSEFSDFSREGLHKGLYLYKVTNENGVQVGSGKVVLE